MTAVTRPCPLLDHFLSKHKMKNDAHTSRKTGISPPTLSKLRHGKIGLTPDMILKLHETFNIPIREIRKLAGA